MIPIEKLQSLTHAIVHANCADGKAAALILKDALPDLCISFVKYDSQEHKSIEPLPHTIFCDFSPYIGDVSKGVNSEPGSVLDMWREQEVIVLDHHDRRLVDPYPFGVFGENDKLECGAWLAYTHVWVPLHDGLQDRRVGGFAHLAAIRDTWKRDDPDFEKACEQASELMFWRFDQLTVDLAVVEGSLGGRLFERQIELAETCIQEAFAFVSDKGTRVLMFQGVSATSDAAELLDKEYIDLPPHLVVGFHYRNDGGTLKLQFSTRSHIGFDCQAFAQAHGGNGHKAAAGFTITVDDSYDPYANFAVLLRHYEASR